MASNELVTKPQVDPRDEPSAEWGWHGEFPNLVQVMGWTVVIALVIMAFIGNHNGNVETIFLLGTALLAAGALVLNLRKRALSWRK